MGPYLGHFLQPTEGVKVRKGGVRMGWSLWLGVVQKSGIPPSFPTITCWRNWGAWRLGPWGGSHQLGLSLETVRRCLGRGSRAKSGLPKTWCKAEIGRGKGHSFSLPSPLLSPVPGSFL